MATEPWYCTRAEVKSAPDYKETARNNAQVDRCIAAGARSIEGLTHRRFYPEIVTLRLDWPDNKHSRSFRKELDDNELISVTSLVAGGTTISSGEYFLRNGRDRDEPPYDHIELNLEENADFSGSAAVHQRNIVIVGLAGFKNDETACGALAEGLDASEVDVDVTNSSKTDVGAILRCDSERMNVTGRTFIDTGVNTGSAMDALDSDDIVDVADGTLFFVDEVLIVNSEKMLIVEIAGNNLIVERAWDGSALAAHLTGQDIYAPRRLTVERGYLGTTAATHNTATALVRFQPPSLVKQLNIAEAIAAVEQENSGYARVAGSGEASIETLGKGLLDLRKMVERKYKRSHGVDWV